MDNLIIYADFDFLTDIEPVGELYHEQIQTK